MLLRFGVANVRSIYQYAEVNLMASTAIKDRGCDLIQWAEGGAEILPVAILYGANASGKTSLYAAMGILKTHVTQSFTRRQATDGIERPYFALDSNAANEPSQLDCDFTVDGVRYHFGFAYNDDRYLREWLHSYPEGYKRVLYERNDMSVEFGNSLRGHNAKLKELIRPNALFLSVAAQGAHLQLTPVYRFFAESVFGLTAHLDDRRTQSLIGKDPDARMIGLLRSADVGISGVRVVDSEGEPIQQVLSDDPEEDSKPVGKTGKNVRVQFAHCNRTGNAIYLDFVQESRGTRRLAALLTRVLEALDDGALVFIDEIDASLHTLLSSELIKLFSNSATNPHGAQLIATTHDTHLLQSNVLRRDQIWFVEKDGFGESRAFPLTDIRTRNTDNLEKGYLEGRFGAVPYADLMRSADIEIGNG